MIMANALNQSNGIQMQNAAGDKHDLQLEAKLIPNWINSDYFRPILKQNESNFAEINNFQIQRATIPGENYCSVLIRVLIKILLKGMNEFV